MVLLPGSVELFVIELHCRGVARSLGFGGRFFCLKHQDHTICIIVYASHIADLYTLFGQSVAPSFTNTGNAVHAKCSARDRTRTALQQADCGKV